MATPSTSPKTYDVRITRIFDAPRARVWEVWTDPKHIKQWWGPEHFTCPAAKINLKVGGTYLYCMNGPKGTEFDKDMWSTGTFKEIIPMEKIVTTDFFSDEHGNVISPKDYGMPGEWPEEMTVTVTFEDAGPSKTKMTIVHTGHPKEMAKMAEMGWNQSLDKFAAAL